MCVKCESRLAGPVRGPGGGDQQEERGEVEAHILAGGTGTSEVQTVMTYPIIISSYKKAAQN